MKKKTQKRTDPEAQLARAIQATITAQYDKCPGLALHHPMIALANVLAAHIGFVAESKESVDRACAIVSTVIANAARAAYDRANGINAPKHPQP